MTKYRYRFKGRFADGSRKIVVERLSGDEVKGFSLPNPEQMWKDIETSNKMLEDMRTRESVLAITSQEEDTNEQTKNT